LAEEVEKPAFGVRCQSVAFITGSAGAPSARWAARLLAHQVKTQTKDAGGGARAPSNKRCVLPAHSKRKRGRVCLFTRPHNVTKQVIRIQPFRDETLVTLISWLTV